MFPKIKVMALAAACQVIACSVIKLQVMTALK
jgi:hypothetical protein